MAVQTSIPAARIRLEIAARNPAHQRSDIRVKKVARKDPLPAAEGAVTFVERVSPVIEQVDGSSGAIGTAVNHALVELMPIIARAPADPGLRATWLERLWVAHEADEMP